MKQKLRFSFTCIILCSLSTRALLAQVSFRQSYQAAMEAYKGKDYDTFLRQMQLTDTLRPNHPTILYNLAVAYVLNDDPQESFPVLRRALWMNSSLPFQEDNDLEAIRSLTPYQDLQSLKRELDQSHAVGSVALQLEEPTMHPEGIAIDPQNGNWYMGSIRQRKIVRITATGEVEDFLNDSSLWAIMGLSLDPNQDVLWACSTAAPEMLAYDTSLTGKSKLLKIDATTGQLQGAYDAPANDTWFGDLHTLPDGRVFVTSSSSTHPAIYGLEEASGQLVEWLSMPDMISLQGITSDLAGKRLFVADYREGILSIDLKTKGVQRIGNETPHPLKGIDGLYWYEGDLIAIHNGLQPFRVVRYELSSDRSAITAFELLDKALPHKGEPTLGVVHQDSLFYIANSPWGAYDEQYQLLPEKTESPIIRSIPLR